MEKKYMERFKGRYCKFVTKEPGENRATVTMGLLEDVDYDDGFIIVDSKQGLGALSISTIVAIKPANQKNKHSNRINDDHAVVGIETLIVFIAMILVAAVTATVLIQTTDTLQQRARYISDQTIKEVSSGIQISDVIGYTNTGQTHLEYLALQVRTTAGSKDMDLSLCTITMLYDKLYALTFNESAAIDIDNKPDNQGVFEWISNNFSLESSEFGIFALHDEDDSLTNTNGINSGDIVLVIINVSNVFNSSGLPPRDSFSGTLQPESGMKASFDIVTPAVFPQRTVDFY
ncbi:MAG: flagellin [Thermoplasmata archaeon]|nr:MAG: flagellin [Thermoplasmata archaeon]